MSRGHRTQKFQGIRRFRAYSGEDMVILAACSIVSHASCGKSDDATRWLARAATLRRPCNAVRNAFCSGGDAPALNNQLIVSVTGMGKHQRVSMPTMLLNPVGCFSVYVLVGCRTAGATSAAAAGWQRELLQMHQ